VTWPALAFRPPTALHRLRAGSRACPLSLRDVAGALLAEEVILPMVLVPSAPVARAALVAAKEAACPIVLSLPAGEAPERWFDAVAQAADEIAPGLPLLLAAEVTLVPGGGVEAARALRLAHRLVSAGITHLAIDADRLAAEGRAEEMVRAADPALERGLGVECLLPPGGAGVPEPEEAFSLLAELGTLGATPDLAGVRLPAPADDDSAGWQAALLSALADAAGTVGLARRGPGAADVLRRIGPGTLRACEDGGAAAAAAGAAASADAAEGRAYAAVADLVDALRAGGTAGILSAALSRARED